MILTINLGATFILIRYCVLYKIKNIWSHCTTYKDTPEAIEHLIFYFFWREDEHLSHHEHFHSPNTRSLSDGCPVSSGFWRLVKEKRFTKYTFSLVFRSLKSHNGSEKA